MTQYTRGRAKEHDARKRFEAEGCYVVRSAGSKGLIDLVALCERRVVLAQVKYTKSGRWMDANWIKLDTEKASGRYPYAAVVAIVYHYGIKDPEYFWGTDWTQ